MEHWENYYRTGAVTSCPAGSAGVYDLEIRDCWVTFFAGLPERARVLDIGTGNGAIALIASDTARSLGRHYEIHGSDLAGIDPRRNVPGGSLRFADIEFHPRVATEELPFESSSFDAVSGQYALEYAPLEPALAEVCRVLRSGGRAQFILHHADSLLVRNARDSLAQARLVLLDTRILEKLRRYLEALRDAPRAAERRRRDLANAVQTLRGAREGAATTHVLRVMLDAVEKLLAASRQLTPTALDREIDRVDRDLRSAVHRLQDLVRVAVSEEGMRQIEQTVAAVGLAVQHRAPQMHDRDNLIGWLLALSRP